MSYSNSINPIKNSVLEYQNYQRQNRSKEAEGEQSFAAWSAAQGSGGNSEEPTKVADTNKPKAVASSMIPSEVPPSLEEARQILAQVAERIKETIPLKLGEAQPVLERSLIPSSYV
ncbi:MAG: hypothetical protein KQJ78_02055 [Deltaproteobacteria bacterium]|nr:hypothetical protein [Deltaproteobacteria bacterium]